MGILQWVFGTTDEPTGEQTYTIAPGYENYVHSLPATGPDGDRGGVIADALITAGILLPAGTQPQTQADWDALNY